MEACFLQADANGDMSLDRDELLAICRARTPPGLPPPDDDKLIALIDELLNQFDANGDGARRAPAQPRAADTSAPSAFPVSLAGLFQFDEFAEAFNVMIERLGVMHEETRKAVLRRQGFITVIPDDELDDDDLEALGLSVKRRYDGECWVVRESELSGTSQSSMTTPRGYGEAPGRNVLSMAAQRKTIPLVLKHPDQDFDNIARTRPLPPPHV